MMVSDEYYLPEDPTKKAAIYQYTLHFNIKVFSSDSDTAKEEAIKQIMDKLRLDEKTVRDALTPSGGSLNSSSIWMGKYYKG